MDLVPNEGQLFDPQLEEQRIAENIEKAHVLEAMPFLDGIVEWFDTQIAESKHIANLQLESSVPLSAQVLAWQVVEAKLTEKKMELEAYIEQYKR